MSTCLLLPVYSTFASAILNSRKSHQYQLTSHRTTKTMAKGIATGAPSLISPARYPIDAIRAASATGRKADQMPFPFIQTVKNRRPKTASRPTNRPTIKEAANLKAIIDRLLQFLMFIISLPTVEAAVCQCVGEHLVEVIQRQRSR